MNVMIQHEQRSEWRIVSQSILKVTKQNSLDSLLDEALDAWLERLAPEMRWSIAIDLYAQEEVSSGRAAEIAGLPYFSFLNKLKEGDLPFLAAEPLSGEKAKHQEDLIHATFKIVQS